MQVCFALLADVQSPPDDRLIPLRTAIQNSQAKRPDFTVFCGDLVDQPDSAAEYANVLPVMAAIQSPLYYVIGNHDADPHSAHYAQRFLAETGLSSTYYSFDYGGYHFLILDTVHIRGGKVCHFGLLSETQLAWVQEDLTAIAKETPVVVFSHNPLLAKDKFGVVNAEEFYCLLKERNLIATFAAHKHYNWVTEVHGVPVIVSGPLSFGLHGQETLGYRWIEIKDHQLTHYWVPVAHGEAR